MTAAHAGVVSIPGCGETFVPQHKVNRGVAC